MKTPAILKIIVVLKRIELAALVFHFTVFAWFLYVTGMGGAAWVILTAGFAVWMIYCYWFHLGQLAKFSPLARWWVIGSTIPMGLIGFRFITAGGIFLPLQMIFYLNLFVLIYLFLPSVRAQFQDGKSAVPPAWGRNGKIAFAVVLIALLIFSHYDRTRILYKYWEVVMKQPLPEGVTILGGRHSSFMDYLVWMELRITPEKVPQVLARYKLVPADKCAQILKYKFEERKNTERFFCYQEDSEEQSSEIFYDKKKDVYYLSAWGN